MSSGLKRAIKIVGTQTALARILGVRQGHIWSWLHRSQAPVTKVVAISHATGWKVTPHELRPDAFPNPWDGLPIWMARAMLCDCANKTTRFSPDGEFTQPVGPADGVGAFLED